MAEQTTTTTETTESGSGGAQSTGQSGASSTTAAVSLTREELDRQLAEARRTGERTARESEEIKQLRQKAKQFDDLDAANKTEAEKLAADRDRHKSEAESLRSKYRTALIKSAFTTKALEAGIPADRIDHAYRLADLSAVTVEEDSDAVKGIDVAIKAVPEWVKAAAQAENGQRGRAPNINPDGGRNGQGAGLTREQAIEAEKARLAGTGKYV